MLSWSALALGQAKPAKPGAPLSKLPRQLVEQFQRMDKDKDNRVSALEAAQHYRGVKAVPQEEMVNRNPFELVVEAKPALKPDDKPGEKPAEKPVAKPQLKPRPVVPPPPTQDTLFMKNIDTNGDGFVDAEEYEKYWEKQISEHQKRMQEAYKRMQDYQRQVNQFNQQRFQQMQQQYQQMQQQFQQQMQQQQKK
jgi:predicted secreted protein